MAEDDALSHALGEPLDVLLRAGEDAAVDARRGEALRDRLCKLRLLDPACGSGAFLVHALERIAGVSPPGAARLKALPRFE